MNREQMEQALSEGKRVRHRHFTDDEWMEQHPTVNDCYVFEDGVVCPKEEFWAYRVNIGMEEGWEIVEKPCEPT